MTVNVLDSDRRDEFLAALIEAVDFVLDPERGWTWKCGTEGDRLGNARAIAADMGMELVTRWCCDCEIVFNENYADTDGDLDDEAACGS